jgi:hypothetical protein
MSLIQEGPGKPPESNPITGVSVSGARECLDCVLSLGTNVSTSMVTLTRSATQDMLDEAPSVCPDGFVERPAAKSPDNAKYPDEVGCQDGNWFITYHRNVPRDEIDGNQCAQNYSEQGRAVLEDGSTTLNCFGPCPNGQRVRGGSEWWRCEDIDTTWNWGGAYNEHIGRDARPRYALVLHPIASVAREVKWGSDKKMFITPDKPIQLKFNGTEFLVKEMAVYRPCPIRVENIQADAVLSLNDYSTEGVSHVILVPISAGVSFGPAGDFIGRVMQNVNAFVMDETTKQFAPIQMPTGNDWSITRLLPTGSENNIVAAPYFTWVGGEYEDVVVEQSANHIKREWRPKAGGITTIMMKEPALVSYLTSTYISMLPYAPSAESAPAPPTLYTFKKGECLTCPGAPSVDPAKLEALQEEAKNKWMAPSALVNGMIGLIISLAGLFAIYYGVTWALDGGLSSANGLVLKIVEWLVMPRPKTPVAQ